MIARRLGVVALAALALVVGVAIAEAQEVEARLDRSRIALGETTTLRVTVRGGGDVRPPTFALPDGLRQITSGRQQSFSWVNGRASTETEFQFEIMGEREGSFQVGPILVAVGSKSFRSGQLPLQVVQALSLGGGSDAGGVPAWLVADAQPSNPYVGQEVILRVRLMQRVGFAEDPQYVPPITTGFWSDRPTAPESYYTQDRNGRVLVTETRTRLYPLAVGDATIGQATAVIVLEGGDPISILGGSGDRQRMLQSREIPVRVRPLPGNAPAGFSGAVGRFETAWSADRGKTSRDVPITVRLDVRGRGNLALIRAPAFTSEDFEVFASTVDDSLGPPGNQGPGRKRFQWTLLPKRQGTLVVEAPSFSWFDAGAEVYRRSGGGAIAIEVGPPIFTSATAQGGLPKELLARPADPGARPAQPWAYALGGAAVGLAARWWRRGGRRPVDPAATEARGLRDRLASPGGSEWWKTAEETIEWLQSRGKVADSPQWRELRERVMAARYGGGAAGDAAVRRELTSRLEAATPRGSSGLPLRVGAVLLAAAGLGACLWFGPRTGDERAARGALAADQAARRGDLELARRGWIELWDRGAQDARLAARIAWSHAQAGEIGPAALWVMRGQIADPREGALRWVEQRVREAGGLVGATPARVPIRALEWAILAWLAAAAAVVLGGRSNAARWTLASLAVLAVAVYPAQGWWAGHSGRAVVLERAVIGGSGVELDPGEMVRLLEERGDRSRVAAGRVTEGWIPARAVARVVPSEADRG